MATTLSLKKREKKDVFEYTVLLLILFIGHQAKAFQPDDDYDSDDDYSDDEELQSPIDEVDPFIFFVESVKGNGENGSLLIFTSYLPYSVCIGKISDVKIMFSCASFQSPKGPEPYADIGLPSSSSCQWDSSTCRTEESRD